MNQHKIYSLVDPAVNQFLVRYIGSTKLSLENRLKEHIYQAKLGIKSHKHSWLRKINFKAQIKLIEMVPKNKSWQKAERKWIKYYRDNGYPLTNLTDGGEGTIGWKPSLKIKKQWSKANKGRIISKEWRRKISLANKGRIPWIQGKHWPEKHREELSRKMKIWHKTHQHPLLGKSGTFLGKKHSDEAKKKNSLAHIGKHHSEKTKRKLSLILKGNQYARKFYVKEKNNAQ